MPHYSQQPNIQSQIKSSINEINIRKVGPGTYKKFFIDKDGIQREEKLVLHDEKAIENARQIDRSIDKASGRVATYNENLNKLATAADKLDKAEANLYNAEERSLRAEKELNERETELNIANENLRSAEENYFTAVEESEIAANNISEKETNLQNAEEQLSQMENASNEAWAEVSTYEAGTLEYDEAIERAHVIDETLNAKYEEVQEARTQLQEAQTEAEPIFANEAVLGEIYTDCSNNAENAEMMHNIASAEFNSAEDERELRFRQREIAQDYYNRQEEKTGTEPPFNQQDVNNAKSQVADMRSKNGGLALGTAQAQEGSSRGDKVVGSSILGTQQTVKANDLFDLRSIKGKESINFRGIGKAQNTISKKDYTLGPSRSFYLQDYRFADSLTINEDLLVNQQVQPIILNEFQPYDMLSPGDVLDGVGNLLIKLLYLPGGAIMQPALKAGSYFITKELIDMYASDTTKLYGTGATRNSAKYFTSDPVQVVQNMFNGGRWLNTYELPYFGGDYLKANYSKNWNLGDSSGFLGKSITDGATRTLGIDFPSNPKFKAKMDDTRDDINIEFYLLNTDNEWLKRNFQFLNAIYAGSNWLHMKFCFIRPPNVYHVICPGRFQIYWAAIDVTVTFEGKLRKNVVVSQELRQYSKAINDDMLWPDAWKMNIKIRDLTPNNFNLYAEYYQNGFNKDEVAALENVKGINNIISDATAYFKELQQDLQPAIDKAKKFAEDGMKSLSGFMENAYNEYSKKVSSPILKAGISENTSNTIQGKQTKAMNDLSEAFMAKKNAEAARNGTYINQEQLKQEADEQASAMVYRGARANAERVAQESGYSKEDLAKARRELRMDKRFQGAEYQGIAGMQKREAEINALAAEKLKANKRNATSATPKK